MLIVIKSYGYGAGFSASVGVSLFHSWLDASEKETLDQMEIEYLFRGVATYHFSGSRGSPTNYISFVLRIDQADYELIKIAVGEVEHLSDAKMVIDISDEDHRDRIGLPTTATQPWESELSSPHQAPIIFKTK